MQDHWAKTNDTAKGREQDGATGPASVSRGGGYAGPPADSLLKWVSCSTNSTVPLTPKTRYIHTLGEHRRKNATGIHMGTNIR